MGDGPAEAAPSRLRMKGPGTPTLAGRENRGIAHTPSAFSARSSASTVAARSAVIWAGWS